MGQQTVTVEGVREAQDHLKGGIAHHEQKEFNEAIESFKKSASIHAEDKTLLSELTKKLKVGGYKLQQKSIAYMGCAAVHLNEMVQQLGDEEKQQVPVDEQLATIFKGWEE